MPAKPTLTVAVVGHVNHGKTALVRALTGIETDRLKEEIERGLSIALGFAWRGYETSVVEFIDAPGHEDFLRATVMGTAGAGAVLLVVSAVESFRPQTWEHLRIAALLGVTVGAVAVTKADLTRPGDEAEMVARVRGTLAGTFLAAAPIVCCSSVTGRGLDGLHTALETLALSASAEPELAGAFLAIDRAFTVSGIGTVVTGTLRGRGLEVGGEGVLEPSGRIVGLRQMQSHGANVDRAEPGGRLAVGLRGVGAADVKVGDALCTPGAFRSAHQVDALITLAPTAARPLKHLEHVAVMWGARRDTGEIRLFGGKAIEPGASALAQIRFAAPVIAFGGQKAVLRRLSPAETIGGARVLDAQAQPSRGRATARRAVLEATVAGDLNALAAALAYRDGGIVTVAEVARLAMVRLDDVRHRLGGVFEVLDEARLVAASTAADARAAYMEAVAEAHRAAPARAGAAVGTLRSRLAARASRDVVAHAERLLAAAGMVRLQGGLVALAHHDPFKALSPEALDQFGQMESRLRERGLTPTPPDALDRDLLELLIDTGKAVSMRNVSLRQTLIFHAESLADALSRLREAFPAGTAFTTGEARATLVTSRKVIVPLLEHFDDRGLTIRRGDTRALESP